MTTAIASPDKSKPKGKTKTCKHVLSPGSTSPFSPRA